MLDNLKVVKMVKSKEKDGKGIVVEKCFNSTMHFIYGFKLTISSIKALWDILKSKNYSFLMTRNLNQDCLENFFWQIRNCGGHCRNPTPIQFSRAFKKLFTLRCINEGSANCIDDVNVVLLNVTPDGNRDLPENFYPRRGDKIFT